MPLTHLDCTKCDRKYPPGQVLNLCECGAPLFARYDLASAAKDMRPGHLALREPTLWRYKEVLPVEDADDRISLGEGFTPLLSAPRLGQRVGLPHLFIKDEAGNPTGSFKARGLSAAVSMAKALGAREVCLPSAGNAGSALAAYAASGGLTAHVFVPKDIPRLFIKDEAGNPTGSFKARGLSAAVSMAKVLGAREVCLPSAGNAGSALAAYAASGGLTAHVFVPKDIPRLFIMETEAYGAHLETVDGLITDAGKVCAERARQHGWYECATLKEPYRVEGKKTMGYELAEQMGWKLPDAILYPTGGGTGLIGMWKAFEELGTMGFIPPGRPRMYAVQAEGCAPIVKAFSEGRDDAPLWEGAQTLAHGLRVPKALGDFLILRALRESGGTGVAVSEREIIEGVRDASSNEGLFMCPEGGACVAALRKLKASGHLIPHDTIVVFNTGTGFKYVETMAPLW